VWLRVAGTAEDRLYREGALPSFWETLFGAGLKRKRRTTIGINASGSRTFDVPTDSLVAALRERLRASAPADAGLTTALAGPDFGVTLRGEQAPGTTLAVFTLSIGFASVSADSAGGAALSRALGAWWAKDGGAVARDVLTPFGFVPRP
jgi:hypothetical protein